MKFYKQYSYISLLSASKIYEVIFLSKTILLTKYYHSTNIYHLQWYFCAFDVIQDFVFILMGFPVTRHLLELIIYCDFLPIITMKWEESRVAFSVYDHEIILCCIDSGELLLRKETGVKIDPLCCQFEQGAQSYSHHN